MPLYNFTLTNLLISFASTVLYFLIAKILSRNRKPHGKEIVYIILLSLLFAVFVQLIRSRGIPFANTIINSLFLFIVFLYLYKIQAESFQVSLILTVFSFIIILIAEIVVLYIVEHIFPAFPDAYEPLPFVLYFLSLYVSAILVTFLLTRAFRGIFVRIMQNSRLLLTLTLVTALLFFSHQVIIAIHEYIDASITLFSWSSAFMLSYVVASLVCFVFYARFQESQSTLREKDIEHRTLLYYMTECEHQQSAMQKFRHDQKNILSSLDLYIEEGDWAGLTGYYTSNIKPAFAIITQSEFALEGLAKIKVREIKSVLAAKLNMAQNLGIEVRFDVMNEINNIPADSVSLVRMLGIVLDNAIEELEFLGAGTLSVACFKAKASINFVVQNTCRRDILPLRQLKQIGFSTKGKGRGVGLDNLSELADALPNVALLTSIENGQFIQTIIVGGTA